MIHVSKKEREESTGGSWEIYLYNRTFKAGLSAMLVFTYMVIRDCDVTTVKRGEQSNLKQKKWTQDTFSKVKQSCNLVYKLTKEC